MAVMPIPIDMIDLGREYLSTGPAHRLSVEYCLSNASPPGALVESLLQLRPTGVSAPQTPNELLLLDLGVQGAVALPVGYPCWAPIGFALLEH